MSHSIHQGRAGETEGEVRVALPWPDKMLSPNARVHWRRKSVATQHARRTTAWVAMSVIGAVKPRWPAAKLDMVFCPPDARRRDTDNLIASTKAHRDGIADALGTDDSKFTVTYSMGKPVKGGSVVVTIIPGGAI